MILSGFLVVVWSEVKRKSEQESAVRENAWRSLHNRPVLLHTFAL